MRGDTPARRPHALCSEALGHRVMTAARHVGRRCALPWKADKLGHSPPLVGSFLGVGLPQGTIAIVYPCSINPPPSCVYVPFAAAWRSGKGGGPSASLRDGEGPSGCLSAVVLRRGVRRPWTVGSCRAASALARVCGTKRAPEDGSHAGPPLSNPRNPRR